MCGLANLPYTCTHAVLELPPPPLPTYTRTHTYIHAYVHTYIPTLLYSFGVTVPNRKGFLGELFADAIVIAIISFVINISQAKLLAKKNSYSIHSDQV